MSLTSLKIKVGACMNKSTSGSVLDILTIMKYTCLQCRKEFCLRPNIDIISLKSGQLHLGKELTVSWSIDCIGAGLDCNVSTQPNPRRGIIVTFKMVPSIARAYATISICFVEGAVAERLVALDCLDER